MPNPSIVPIVEGLSEVESVPILLRRILSNKGIFNINIEKPFRVKRNRIVKKGEIEKTITLALRSRINPKAFILILDSDDDCPVELNKYLSSICVKTTNLPVSIVIAQKEFECWLLGAKESLRGFRDIKIDAKTPNNPEKIRGAKERLSSNMNSRSYLEVVDQPAFASHFDIQQAQSTCPSFAKLLRETERLISYLTQ